MNLFASAIIQQRTKECLDKTEERITWLLRTEEHPFSLNADFYNEQRAKYLAEYMGSYGNHNHSRVMDYLQDYNNGKRTVQAFVNNRYVDQPTGVAKVLVTLAEIGMADIKAEDLPKLFSCDQMHPALVIMADVRAYFEG